MKVGDELTVCDTKGRDYDCMIEEIGGREVRLKVLSVAPSQSEPDVRVHLYQAMPKADKMTTISEGGGAGRCQHHAGDDAPVSPPGRKVDG